MTFEEFWIEIVALSLFCWWIYMGLSVKEKK